MLPGSNQQVEQTWVTAVRRSAGKETNYVNRLALSESAYLKQHATNPIDWYPWADSAFLRAETENKLILLSIGYASCHWCHVMEEESFSDIEVASVLNQSMVSIKVDREQQPDIDAYFTLVVETIKGESGWPMTLILLPDRTPVFAANYLGKDQLITTVTRLNKMWQEQPGAVKQNSALILEEINRRNTRRNTKNTSLDAPVADVAMQRLLEGLDPDYGGFGNGAKFPGELKLQFLLNRYKSTHEVALKQVLTRQLDTLMNGGMTDVVFGGVFRYTTDRQMSRPHFEKMLYNQALTVRLFADAANWLEEPAYKHHAESIVDFVNQSMRLPDGTYAAAIDADYKGVEGGYYLWSEDLYEGLEDGVSRVAFGDGLVYLYGTSETQTNDWRSEFRQKRPEPPRRIDNRLTAWNALWLSALLQLDELGDAEDLAKTIWENCWSKNQLYRMGGQTGFLDDYSYLSNAYWQLYLKTEDQIWKKRARLLDSRILDLFYFEGKISYRNRSADGVYDVGAFQDTELPSPLALALSGFSNHQTELRFIEAYENLIDMSLAAIGDRPESFLTLLGSTGKQGPASRLIVAKGHGMVSLQSMDDTGQWQLVFNLDENWHINASEVLDERMIPTQILKSDRILMVQYPQGDQIATEFSEQPLNVYSNRVVIEISAQLTLSELSLVVKYQACSNQVCLLPEQVDLIAYDFPEYRLHPKN